MPSLFDYLNRNSAVRGWNVEQYQRGRWIYIRITREFSTSHPLISRRVTGVVRQWYPTARLVKRDEMAIVYNIGTVFDAIVYCDEKPRDLPWAHTILRVKLPKKNS